MTYLQQVEQDLLDFLKNGEPNTDEIIEYVKDRIVESYKNGLRAAKQRGARRQFAKSQNITSR